MDSNLLRSILQRALVCASQDETRPHLCGVQIDMQADGRLAFRATSGQVAFRLQIPDTNHKKGLSVLVPSAAVKTWVKALPFGRHKGVPCQITRECLSIGSFANSLPTNASGEVFYPLDRVIPKLTNTRAIEGGQIGIDPVYYGTASVVFKDVRPLPDTSTYGDALSPITVHSHGGAFGDIDLVIMPFRL